MELPAWIMPPVMRLLRRLGVLEDPETVYTCKLCGEEVPEHGLKWHRAEHGLTSKN